MRSRFSTFGIFVARLLVGAMLFSQLANAGQACIQPVLSPVMAFFSADHAPDCAKRVNPNSCLQQSTATDQSIGDAGPTVLGMPNVVVLIIPREAAATSFLEFVEAILHRSADPPCSIRFCSFQL